MLEGTKRIFLVLRRMTMNRLMATRWYPPLRRRFRKRASTGTGDMRAEDFAAHVANVFATYRKHLKGKIDDFHGLRVLEVGPGEHLGIGLLFVAAGARQTVCADRFREARDESPEVRRMYDELRKLLRDSQAREVFDLALKGLARAEQDRSNPVVYVSSLPLEDATPELLGRFDLIVSTSVLEHVSDLRGCMRAMSDLLNPGGWIAHCADLGSHDRYERGPLEFLETGERLWNLQFSNIGGPNRRRAPDYARFLQEAGFADAQVIVDARFPESAARRAAARAAPPFAGMSAEDLSPAVIFVLGRKPAAQGIRQT